MTGPWGVPCKLVVSVVALIILRPDKEVPKSDKSGKPHTVLNSEPVVTQSLPWWLGFLAAVSPQAPRPVWWESCDHLSPWISAQVFLGAPPCLGPQTLKRETWRDPQLVAGPACEEESLSFLLDGTL